MDFSKYHAHETLGNNSINKFCLLIFPLRNFSRNHRNLFLEINASIVNAILLYWMARILSCYQIFTQLKISTSILSIKIIGQLGTGKRGLCNLIKNVLSVVGFAVRAMSVCV
jgi:hypothetical protein